MRRRDQKGQSIIEMAVILPVLLLMFLGAWTAATLIGNQDAVAQGTGTGARVAASLGNDGWVTGADTPSGCQTLSGDAAAVEAADPCAVDDAVLAAITPALSQLANSTIKYIYIYEPGSCLPNSAGDLPSSCISSDTSTSQGALPLTAADAPDAGTVADQYKYCETSTGPAVYSWTLVNGTGEVGTPGQCPAMGANLGIAPYTLADRSQLPPDEEAIGVEVLFTFSSPGLAYFSQTDTKYTDISLPPEAE
jgi:hypothetical protein